MYTLSKDYGKLFDLLCAGNVAVGWVDYVFDRQGGETQRDIAQIRRYKEYDIFIGVRGVCYGSIYPFHQKEGDERSLFVNLCKSLSLEWIEPTIPRRADVAAALAELRAEIDSLIFKKHHGAPYEALHDAQRCVDTTTAALLGR